MQICTDLTDAGGRLIAEGLKGNCSVTWVDLEASAGELMMLLLLLTCVEQTGGDRYSDSVKREVDSIISRNRSEPEQRQAEIEAIKQVC
jgi:hypothetical protein